MSDHVARYYEANTGRFLLVGPRGGVPTIHREVWGPGVDSRREAADWIHGLLARQIQAADMGAEPRILDLGCGVGGTVVRLAELLPGARLHGVTLSPRQVDLARELLERRGLTDRCSVARADFQQDDVGEGYDVAVAIESFAHAESPGSFFRTAARALRPGGLLLVVDDFLVRPDETLGARQRRRVEEFRAGWRVDGLCTAGGCSERAGEAGFHPTEVLAPTPDGDLTDLVRLGRPRDRVIAALVPGLRLFRLASVPFFGNMIGGDALQSGLRDGFLRYRLLAWTRGAGS